MTDDSTASTQQGTLAALMDALEFSPDDLEANREGKLSIMQDWRMRTRRRRSIAMGVALVLIFAFIASLLIFYGGREDSVILTIVGIGVTLCSAAITGVLGRYWLRLTADIRGGGVTTLTGELERVLRPVSRRVITYMVRVDGAEMFVSRQAFEAFVHEGRYALHRAPYTGALLTAEPLDGDLSEKVGA
jgi:hypothetical protein